MKKSLTIASIFLVSLTSCSHDEMTTTAEGYVYEINSTTPIPNAKVYIAREKLYRFNTKYILLDSTTCNANGKYKLSSTSSNVDLVLFAKKDGYYDMLVDIETNLTPGEYNSRNIYPIPPAWVRVNFDQLDLTHGIAINPPIGSNLLQSVNFSNDTSQVIKTYGNSVIELSTFYYENANLIKQEYHTVTTGSRDTTDINLSF